MSDERSTDDTAKQAPSVGTPSQKPKIEVVFVPEPTDDMAEVVQLEELIPDDGLDNDDAADDATQPRGGDFLGSTALIVLLVVVSAILTVVAFTSFGAQAIACSDFGACNGSVISFGTQLVLVGIPLLTLATIVVTIVRIVRRKLAFPVVLIGIAACVILYVIAAFLVGRAVPN